MNLLSMVDFETSEVILEATDTKGAVEFLQNAFNKAGLAIAVKGSGTTLKCYGTLNRSKFSFTISLVNGKLSADFSGLNVESMVNPPAFKVGKDFRAGVQNYIVNADNAIAELRAVKTFLMRVTRVMERVTVVAQKNPVKKVVRENVDAEEDIIDSLNDSFDNVADDFRAIEIKGNRLFLSVPNDAEYVENVFREYLDYIITKILAKHGLQYEDYRYGYDSHNDIFKKKTTVVVTFRGSL